MSAARECAAWFVAAPASNHGKTTVTAALARFHAGQGRAVRVFKCGPDFIDPMILEQASGQPVYQLDLWMAGAAECRQRVYEAAQHADLILIEGVMGLFDGAPCSADLAAVLDVPVLAVIDAAGMAQTLGAVAHGLATYRPGLRFAGVLANSVASARHEEMIVAGMPPGLPWLGSLPRAAQAALPARHLGLVQAQEVPDLAARLAASAALLGKTALAVLPPAVRFPCPAQVGHEHEHMPLPAAAGALSGVRIGIARDAAFSFLYAANLDTLRGLGAELHFFSPLTDAALPEVDSLYLPGGYPELHLAQLSANTGLAAALHRHVAQGKPLLAECGGLLYLLESLTDKAGQRAAMAGVLPGHAVMTTRLQGLGYQSARLASGVLRGHTFHHSLIDTPLQPYALGERVHNTSPGERIFQLNRLVASYIHAYFPSNPAVVADLFKP